MYHIYFLQFLGRHSSGSIVYRYPQPAHPRGYCSVSHMAQSGCVCVDGEVEWGRMGTHTSSLWLFLLFCVKSQIVPYSFQMCFPPISYKVYLQDICGARLKSRYQPRKSGVRVMRRGRVFTGIYGTIGHLDLYEGSYFLINLNQYCGFQFADVVLIPGVFLFLIHF